MKYTFTIADGAAGAGGDGTTAARREKLVLESRAGESDRHIALKALAYVLFRDQTGGPPLRVEQGVGQRHKPDLVATDAEPPHPVRLWIDCGAIEPRRLARIVAANPAARVVVVKPNRAEALGYARAAAPHIPTVSAGKGKRATTARSGTRGDLSQVTGPLVFGFDDTFFEAVRLSLRSRNDWSVRVPADALTDRDAIPDFRFALHANDETARETALYRFPVGFAAT